MNTIKKWVTWGSLGALLLGVGSLAPASASDIRFGVQVNIGPPCRVVRPVYTDYRYRECDRHDDWRRDRDRHDYRHR